MKPDRPELDRRQLLGAGLVVAATVGPPLYVWSRIRSGEEGEASARERAMLDRVADLTIPATDTPGALAVGVPAFVVLALNHGLEGTRPSAGVSNQPVPGTPAPQGGMDILSRFADALDRAARGDFLRRGPAEQAAALTSLDAQAFASDAKDAPWRKIKALIVTGYYTSEAGASRELSYELVPGRWDPDLPLVPGMHAWSSDWTAAAFG